ncbi:hypothetical protein [Halobaculum sp. CBA1158]|uniref:LVIVD repeat-containing protein n=1 Tax=Halobaculum sp. CBA1158 TaxID=2904243 RepID=UPI0026E55877|nr:hypothetical protein [Halobaculum sp. CBA1158]
MRRRCLLRSGGSALAASLGVGTVVGRAAGDDGDGSPAGDDAFSVGDDAPPASSDPYAPLGRLDLAGTREAVVSTDGRTAYLALGDGYATVDCSDPSDPTVLAERREPLADRAGDPFGLVHDVSVSGDRLAVVGPAERRGGLARGLLVVDVSDPADPEEVGFHETTFPIHNCTIDGRYCYLTGNGQRGEPVVVVDAESPAEVGRWSLFDADEAWADVDAGLRTVHDVTVRDGVAAVAYWDAGTALLDVSDPSAPVLIGRVDPGDPAALRDPPPRESFVPPGNHHVAVLAPGGDTLAVGRESWAVERDGGRIGGPSGVDLYDVSDPAEPSLLSTVAPPATPDPTFDGVWTTAHNLDIADGTLYTSWYQGGVKRHDISDPADPVEETWWADPEAARFWTAVAGERGSFFLASSMGTDGGAPAGVWTFPDAAGVGGSRDRLRADAEGDDAGDGSTDSPTAESSTAGSPSTGTDGSGGATADRAGDDDGEDGTGDGETKSHAAGPGFGVAGAVGGLLASGALALGRARRRSGGSEDCEG